MQALLSDGPVDRPTRWLQMVNEPLNSKEEKALQVCETRSRPYGEPNWQAKTAARLGLLHTLRPEGRPAKQATTRKN